MTVLLCWMYYMLSVTIKPFMLSVVMPNVTMLSVVATIIEGIVGIYRMHLEFVIMCSSLNLSFVHFVIELHKLDTYAEKY